MEHKDIKSCKETPGTNTQRHTDGTSLDSEMRWKNFGETTTKEGHEGFLFVLLFFSVEKRIKEDKHEHGVGFLVHKDIVSTVKGCRPLSSRLITTRPRAVPFNVTIV